jgi:putative PIN family toxin of toxin-antitoxin system
VGKKVKVVFDSNVWVSIFMEEVLYEKYSQYKEELTIFASRDIILELTKVLLYPKIAKILEKSGLSNKDVIRALSSEVEMVEPKVKLQVVEDDHEDNKILECALACRAEVIVSGDKHLLGLGKFEKIRILAPREFFDSFV